MGRRRQAREQALQILYGIDLSGDPVHQAIENFSAMHGATVHDQAEYLVYEATRQRETIDKILERHVTHWSIERLSAVDRNLLRLGVTELLCCDDIPPKVTINECVEIAKRFGDDESPAFVNGVIDKIAQDDESIAAAKRLTR